VKQLAKPNNETENKRSARKGKSTAAMRPKKNDVGMRFLMRAARKSYWFKTRDQRREASSKKKEVGASWEG